MKKVFIVKQHDITDCGPACISSVIKYYGGYVPIEVLRIKCETDHNGSSAYNMIETLKFYNFKAKGYKVKSVDDIKRKNTLPCIAHLKLKNNLQHFVVIYEITKTSVVLMDPAKGKVKMKISDFNKVFSNVIILMQPQSTLMKYQKPNSIYKIFMSIFKDNKRVTFNLVLNNVILVFLSVLINYFLKFGSATSEGEYGLIILIYLFILFLFIYLVKNYIEYIKNKLIIFLNKNISADLYEKFSHQLFVLPLNFIKSKTSGEIISRYNELSQINEMIPDFIVTTLLDLIMIFITLLFAFSISIKLTLISIVIMTIYALFCYTLKNPTLNKVNSSITLLSAFNTDIIDNVNTIISTKYMNNENNMERRLEKSGVRYLQNKMQLNSYFNKCEFIKNMIFDLGKWLVLSYGLYLCFVQKLNLINLFTFEMLINYFYEPIKDICAMIPKIGYMKSSLYKLNEFSIIKEENRGIYSFEPGLIKVSGLTFNYDYGNFSIKNLNFFINKNDKVLIQGKSGSGKSTFCQILSRQLDYKEGSIKVDNIEIKDIKIDDFRKNITYIGQKDSLLVDTIFKNIIYERNISGKEFKTICDICEIDEIVNRKVNRFNTLISESSMNISGGEKQRIILARGLLNSGKIIIMDEVLSEVNKDMDEKIIKRIFDYFKNKTIIYVSHKEYKNIFNRRIVFNS